MARFFTILNLGILVLALSTFVADGLYTDDQQLREMRESYIEIRQMLVTTETKLAADVQGLKTKVNGLEEMVAIMRTCHETRAVDPSLPSGMYWIDPDGQGVGDEPIYVYCNMATGSTSISHDSESQTDVGHCAEPGCYSRIINYNATMRQIEALAGLSNECHQSIRYDCVSAPLEINDVAYSWWNDLNGNAQYFWAGNNAEVHTCQCGIDGNCVEPSTKCNCDSGLPTLLADSGVVTEKNVLPVTRLNFGGTQPGSAVHTLGQYECSGYSATGMPTSCTDLWLLGHTLNGLYSIMGLKQVESVYCDFTKLPQDPNFQKWIGYIDIKSSPVYFYVQKNIPLTLANTPIPFELERLNIGSAMDLSTGIFTVPRNGRYFFSFSGIADVPASSTRLEFGSHMYHNGNRIGSAWADASPTNGEFETYSLQSTMNLLAGDQIWMQITRLDTGVTLFDNFNCHTHFTGLLLEEDISASQNMMG